MTAVIPDHTKAILAAVNRHGADDATRATMTAEDLFHRCADLFRKEIIPGVPCPGRAALGAAIRNGYLRVEPAPDRNVTGHGYTSPSGRDRLILTAAGADHLYGPDAHAGNALEDGALIRALADLHNTRRWIQDAMLSEVRPTTHGAITGVQYEHAAGLLAQAIAALARAGVTSGQYLTREAFLGQVLESARIVLG